MPFQSEFSDSSKLNACAINDSDHIGEQAASRGPWVVLIKKALNAWAAKQLPPVGQIPVDDQFGRETGDLVALYKTKQSPPILNFAGKIDRIVGKKTVVALDKELPARGRGSAVVPTHESIMAGAFQRSRQSLGVVLLILLRLEADIERAERADGFQKLLAIQTLGRNHARNIAVLALRLKVSKDPLSTEFRTALRQARDLIQRNLGDTSEMIDQGDAGRCAPGNFNPPGIPFAATTRTDPNPRVSVCVPFFSSNPDLQRDVVTHEFFHVLGLADISVANTSDALNNANTMAQIVAFLHDRFRQHNSDGNELAVPPLPMP